MPALFAVVRYACVSAARLIAGLGYLGEIALQDRIDGQVIPALSIHSLLDFELIVLTDRDERSRMKSLGFRRQFHSYSTKRAGGTFRQPIVQSVAQSKPL